MQVKLLIETYIVRKTYTFVALEINNEEEYNIIVLESDNNKRVITLEDNKLSIEKVSLLKSESSQ